MRVVLVLALVLALSGCFGKGLSQAEMESEAVQAIGHFREAILPAGELQGIDVSGSVSMESVVNGFPVTVTLNPEMAVRLGPAGDLHIAGDALRLEFEAYCSPDTVIAITEGGADYDVPDMSVEARNPLGYCTGAGSEQLLLPFFEFELIDPALMTGDIDLDALVPIGFDDLDGAIAATYETEGPQGITTLTFQIDDGRIQQIVSQNEDGQLVLDMSYGKRSALTVPEADLRLPNVVRGTGTTNEDGWTWTGRLDAGPSDEFSIVVYEPGSTVACGGAASKEVVRFALGDGADQQKEGWRMVHFDDGDSRLGENDQVRLIPPSSSVSIFDYVVKFHDDWAGAHATTECAIPNAGVAWLVGGLGFIAVVRRF